MHHKENNTNQHLLVETLSKRFPVFTDVIHSGVHGEFILTQSIANIGLIFTKIEATFEFVLAATFQRAAFSSVNEINRIVDLP